MATLDSLKGALRQKAIASGIVQKQPLSDIQYSAGFDILLRGPGWMTYQDFIIPQLSQLLAPLLDSRNISVLEIGPGPKSVLGHLPGHLRQRIRRYAAFEPNDLLATRLQNWLSSTSETESPLPCLESPVDIYRVPFDLNSNANSGTSASTGTHDSDEKFDVILFCHSMYGMEPKVRFIERALEMLVEEPEGGIVVIFHRDKTLHLDELVCHRTASFPTGAVRVANDDDALDSFAPFIAGFIMQDVEVDKAIRVEWREVCRALGRRQEADPDHLVFSSPNIMAAFTRHATSLSELTAQVPLVEGGKTVKNREACLQYPAAIMRPTELQHVQQCVRWALQHGVSLTVVGGGHSGHCLRSNVVSVDMSAFNNVHILTAGNSGQEAGSDAAALVVAEAGSSNLARSFASAMYQANTGLPGAVRPQNETDLLWAIKGAGTNFGIVVSVTFKAYAASMFSVRNWVVPLSGDGEAQSKLHDFDNLVARKLPQSCSADAYLYWDIGKLHLGVTLFESSTARYVSKTPLSTLTAVETILGPEDGFQMVDGVGLFETEMYMSRMHGGHASSKTSSFKRCLFLNRIGARNVAEILVAAIETPDATAFGCRDWDFACVITGVWPRDQDGTEVARAAVRWVYNVASNLLPVSSGVYGADLGPDPRDTALAIKAFGPNLPRLARLKHKSDPRNVLAYTCPLPKTPTKQKLIILVTGESCAGKDYCGEIWVSAFLQKGLIARVVSISDETKREYAAATGTDLNCLLRDRTYKEQHRAALTAFFQRQVRDRPRLPEEHFLNVVYGAGDVDVLLITGMRDKAPVTLFSHLVPHSRLLDVHINARKETRQARRGCHGGDADGNDTDDNNDSRPKPKPLDYHPSLIFNNDTTGNEAVKRFAEDYLLPFLDEDFQRLANMVRPVPDFPRPGVKFRHVLNIAQQPGGLALCTSLLQTHFTGDWSKVDMIVSCETGGFIYASVLASQVDVPLALIREIGKLPPPTVSVLKSTSHISSISNSNEKRIGIERDLIPRGASVVVVDDVLATGNTLCAVLQLLSEVGFADVSIMVVAEFPVHRGRELLRQHGFGVNIKSLLVFDGA
ncbi:Higher eukaryotic phosphomevalonate kinase [Penicillium expansum]|nr:Higher eukaryotic phosphomevalonate kinase [Penicillium expansum]